MGMGGRGTLGYRVLGALRMLCELELSVCL